MAPRPRFEKLASEKREEILAAAGEEFGDKGFVGASFNKIIARAGISKGAAYYYFDDKADLYNTVVDYVVDSFMQLTDDLVFEGLTEENFWDIIADQSRRSMKQLRRYPWMVRVIRTAMSSTGQHRLTEHATKVGRVWTERFLTRGQALGVIREDLPMEFLSMVAFNFGMTVDHWVFEHLDEWSADDEELWIQRLMDLFKRLLEPQEEAS